MKETLRYGFILAVICIAASGLLAGMNSLTKARIISQAQAEEQTALKDVMPDGNRFEAVKKDGDTAYYKVYDRDNKFIGAAFKAQGKGYSSTIETLAGMNSDGSIVAIKVLSHNETPGLGARVSEPDFTGRFSGKKDLSEVQAITGATISSKAVIDSVKAKAEELKGVIKDER